MEEIKILAELLQRYGWTSVITLFLFWDRFLKPQWRKRVSGEFVHWKDLKIKLDEDNAEIKSIKRIMNNQIDKEIEKERRMNVLEVGHIALEKNVEDLKYFLRDVNSSMKTNNRLQGEIKDALTDIKNKNG